MPEHGYWEGGTGNFTMERALEWQRERENRSMMTSTQPTSDIRALPLVALVFSETPAQIERRKGFNPEKLQELAESIKSEGLLQPIVVRPLPTHDYEVVAGERRVRASKIAGKEEILASVRDLTDRRSSVEPTRHSRECSCASCHYSQKFPQVKPHHATCGCFECAPEKASGHRIECGVLNNPLSSPCTCGFNAENWTRDA